MEQFATTTDLEDYWGKDLDDKEQTRADALLKYSKTIIVTKLEQHKRRLPTADVLKLVSCDMVKRALLTPVDQAPVSSLQEMAGAFMSTQTFSNPTGNLYLSADNLSLLGLKNQRIGSIEPAINYGGGGGDAWR